LPILPVFYRVVLHRDAEYVSNLWGMEWPVAGKTVTWKEPTYLSDTPCMFGPMHKVGQDNDYVYGKLLGLSKAEIKKLTEEGVFK
jgi:hypothetical protein